MSGSDAVPRLGCPPQPLSVQKRVAWTSAALLISSCCRVLLAMAAPPQDILLHPRPYVGDTAISHKAANRYFKEWRTWMSTAEDEVGIWGWDLSHEAFDWRRCLSHHPQSEELVGDGVIKFEIRFLNSWDHNMKQPRCDFVVHRADGTAARLHPSPSGPGEIVTSLLDDWLPHGHKSPVLLERDAAGAAEYGFARPFRTLHQVDTISRKATCELLERN